MRPARPFVPAALAVPVMAMPVAYSLTGKRPATLDLGAACRDGLAAVKALGLRSRIGSLGGMVLEDKLSARMAAAQDGDAASYRMVLRECLPVIASVARAQGVQGAAVDDVVQETLLTLHNARQTYDPGRPFLPFLRAIAKRRAIDALRRRGRRPQEVHDPIAFDTRADDAPAPGAALEADDRKRLLRSAVESLPPSQREAVEHLAFAERSLDETSALTGRSKVALKVNLHRALKALREKLAGDRERKDV